MSAFPGDSYDLLTGQLITLGELRALAGHPYESPGFERPGQ